MTREVGTGKWTHVLMTDSPAHMDKREGESKLTLIVGGIWWKAEFDVDTYQYIESGSGATDEYKDLKKHEVGEYSQCSCHVVMRLRAELQPSGAVWSTMMRTNSRMGSGYDGTLTTWSFTKITLMPRITLLMCVSRILVPSYTDTIVLCG